MTGRFHIHTLGCKANAYDSQLLYEELCRRGWSRARAGEVPDLVIVNSCTVTGEADRQSRKIARRLGRKNPRARVVVTGCAAEVDPARTAQTERVHYVIGNQDKPRLVELILAALGSEAPEAAEVLGAVKGYGSIKPRHAPDRAWPEPEAAFLTPGAEGLNTRVFLKVQEGCDAFCTFCIIPLARGPARSLRPATLVRQVKSLVARGVKEVVLTGTALGDYGRDLGSPEGPGPTFEEIVALILRETALPRLRLSSLAPDELTEGLLGLFEAEPRLCPHVHLSLQSPHTTILRRMKRRYDGALAARSLRALAELGARLAARGLPGGLFVGMDLITGFPGETEAIFQESYQALEALPWHRLHLFPYSEREGTAATRLGGAVPIPERRARLRALMALSNTRLETHLQAVVAEGTPLEILAEGPTRPPEGQGGTWCSGTTRNYLRVLFSSPAPASQRNQVLHVRPTATHPDPRAGDGAILATPL